MTFHASLNPEYFQPDHDSCPVNCKITYEEDLTDSGSVVTEGVPS